MRFLCVLTHNPSNAPPTQAQMESMGKLIGEGMQAGWLLECEGVQFGTTGTRVRKETSGQIAITDGPFSENQEVLGGYALLNVANKQIALQQTHRFLEHVHQGSWEVYQLFELP